MGNGAASGISLFADWPFVVRGTNERAQGTNPDNANFNNETIVPAATVTLKAGEGSGEDQSVQVARGGDYTAPECPFAASEGRAFIGWQKGDDTSTYNLLAPGDVIEDVPLAMTLTARWGQTYAAAVSGVQVDGTDAGEAAKSYIAVDPTTGMLPGTRVTLALRQPEYLDLVSGDLKATREDDSTPLAITWTSETTCTFTMPEGNVSVTGEFAINTKPVSYVDAAGGKGKSSPVAGYTQVVADQTQWGAESNESWYVLNQSVTLTNRVAVCGNVNLILCDGATLTASKGIGVANGNNLTIWAQSLGGSKGKIVASASVATDAAIGGTGGEECGSITINGGSVSAGLDATNHSAAIGSGGVASVANNSNTVTPSKTDGSITINGGEVAANAYGGAAIGSGRNKSIGPIAITGGRELTIRAVRESAVVTTAVVATLPSAEVPLTPRRILMAPVLVAARA